MNLDVLSEGTKRRVLSRGYQRNDSFSARPKSSSSIIELDTLVENINPANSTRRIHTSGQSLIERRNIEPFSPLSLNSPNGFRRDNKNCFTPKKAKSPMTIAKKAASVKKQSRYSAKNNDTSTSTIPPKIPNQKKESCTPPKGPASTIPKFSPGLRKIISKYGNQHYGSSSKIEKKCSVDQIAESIGQVTLPLSSSSAAAPSTKLKHLRYSDHMQHHDHTPTSSSKAIGKPQIHQQTKGNDSFMKTSTTANTSLARKRFLKGKALARKAAARSIAKDRTIECSKSMELYSEPSESMNDSSIVLSSKSMDQYSDAKHGKQYPNGPVEPHASPLLLDKGRRAEVMEFHKRRQNASLTRNAIDQSQDTPGSSAQKVERGRSMSRTNRDCTQEKNEIKRNTNPLPPVRGRCATTTINNPVGTAMGPVNIPQIRSRSVSGAVRDRMQSKRASAASNSPVPSARGRHEKETATSHRKDGSLTQRERGTSLPPDLQRTDSDSTDGNSVELVSQSYSFASASSDEQSVLQLKRQKARAMLARRKKSIRS